jgi:hypothetical protein
MYQNKMSFLHQAKGLLGLAADYFSLDCVSLSTSNRVKPVPFWFTTMPRPMSLLVLLF